MLSTVNLTQRYGKRVLFDKINITLDAGKRYGLIGANGAGKSTFMKILAGELEPSDGEVQLQPGLKLGMLSQNQYAFEDFTLKDAVLYGNKKLYDAQKEKEKLYMEGDFESDEVNNRLAELEMICADEDPTYESDVKIEKLLTTLGFPVEQHDDLMSSLTGGDKFKILLAQVLFLKPDVLLLDEPTNNLDMETIAWLENELKRHEGTLLVISHDRHFLNGVVTHILDLDFQNIREFTGNYDEWYIAANLISKQAQSDRSKALKEKEELEKFIARFSANASKAKQATSRQKQLDKLDVQEIKLSSRRDPSIMFKPHREIGNEVLEVENLSKSYGDEKVLENISFKVNKGDKIALIGANGVGKTTLLEILMGKLEADSGKFNWGQTITTTYFPQNTTDVVVGDEELPQWIQGFDPKWHIDDIRKTLGRMLFSGEEQKKKIDACSGGEKHRVMLSKMMMDSANFLVLDEPNNHLDLEAIVALGEALHNYQGGAICVSHDRELIDAFANRIIKINEDGTVTDFEGNYEDFVEQHEN
ncbi:ABC-F family ATP-binding cassette domain-containing protein [Sulfurovum sp. NBC37-1]|uniref:ABC-F family ATP-binding cassette domain-containing protein n=1 Tax=Sulfurovum sp. (strain NBC37-1) TaxID=387093 RepID=UPI0001587A3B|nr:ATP-binding cassette domain-containing protein [Sulfurovum sp. NBC37-1]BAF72426.1 ABC transporter, ATP-binding protein [Sulfurovum sp. NBC37-1]